MNPQWPYPQYSIPPPTYSPQQFQQTSWNIQDTNLITPTVNPNALPHPSVFTPVSFPLHVPPPNIISTKVPPPTFCSNFLTPNYHSIPVSNSSQLTTSFSYVSIEPSPPLPSEPPPPLPSEPPPPLPSESPPPLPVDSPPPVVSDSHLSSLQDESSVYVLIPPESCYVADLSPTPKESESFTSAESQPLWPIDIACVVSNNSIYCAPIESSPVTSSLSDEPTKVLSSMSLALTSTQSSSLQMQSSQSSSKVESFLPVELSTKSIISATYLSNSVCTASNSHIVSETVSSESTVGSSSPTQIEMLPFTSTTCSPVELNKFSSPVPTKSITSTIVESPTLPMESLSTMSSRLLCIQEESSIVKKSVAAAISSPILSADASPVNIVQSILSSQSNHSVPAAPSLLVVSESTASASYDNSNHSSLSKPSEILPPKSSRKSDGFLSSGSTETLTSIPIESSAIPIESLSDISLNKLLSKQDEVSVLVESSVAPVLSASSITANSSPVLSQSLLSSTLNTPVSVTSGLPMISESVSSPFFLSPNSISSFIPVETLSSPFPTSSSAKSVEFPLNVPVKSVTESSSLPRESLHILPRFPQQDESTVAVASLSASLVSATYVPVDSKPIEIHSDMASLLNSPMSSVPSSFVVSEPVLSISSAGSSNSLPPVRIKTETFSTVPSSVELLKSSPTLSTESSLSIPELSTTSISLLPEQSKSSAPVVSSTCTSTNSISVSMQSTLSPTFNRLSLTSSSLTASKSASTPKNQIPPGPYLCLPLIYSPQSASTQQRTLYTLKIQPNGMHILQTTKIENHSTFNPSTTSAGEGSTVSNDDKDAEQPTSVSTSPPLLIKNDESAFIHFAEAMVAQPPLLIDRTTSSNGSLQDSCQSDQNIMNFQKRQIMLEHNYCSFEDVSENNGSCCKDNLFLTTIIPKDHDYSLPPTEPKPRDVIETKLVSEDVETDQTSAVPLKVSCETQEEFSLTNSFSSNYKNDEASNSKAENLDSKQSPSKIPIDQNHKIEVVKQNRDFSEINIKVQEIDNGSELKVTHEKNDVDCRPEIEHRKNDDDPALKSTFEKNINKLSNDIKEPYTNVCITDEQCRIESHKKVHNLDSCVNENYISISNAEFQVKKESVEECISANNENNEIDAHKKSDEEVKDTDKEFAFKISKLQDNIDLKNVNIKEEIVNNSTKEISTSASLITENSSKNNNSCIFKNADDNVTDSYQNYNIVTENINYELDNFHTVVHPSSKNNKENKEIDDHVKSDGEITDDDTMFAWKISKIQENINIKEENGNNSTKEITTSISLTTGDSFNNKSSDDNVISSYQNYKTVVGNINSKLDNFQTVLPHSDVHPSSQNSNENKKIDYHEKSEGEITDDDSMFAWKISKIQKNINIKEESSNNSSKEISSFISSTTGNSFNKKNSDVFKSADDNVIGSYQKYKIVTGSIDSELDNFQTVLPHSDVHPSPNKSNEKKIDDHEKSDGEVTDDDTVFSWKISKIRENIKEENGNNSSKGISTSISSTTGKSFNNKISDVFKNVDDNSYQNYKIVTGNSNSELDNFQTVLPHSDVHPSPKNSNEKEIDDYVKSDGEVTDDDTVFTWKISKIRDNVNIKDENDNCSRKEISTSISLTAGNSFNNKSSDDNVIGSYQNYKTVTGNINSELDKFQTVLPHSDVHPSSKNSYKNKEIDDHEKSDGEVTDDDDDDTEFTWKISKIRENIKEENGNYSSKEISTSISLTTGNSFNSKRSGVFKNADDNVIGSYQNCKIVTENINSELDNFQTVPPHHNSKNCNEIKEIDDHEKSDGEVKNNDTVFAWKISNIQENINIKEENGSNSSKGISTSISSTTGNSFNNKISDAFKNVDDNSYQNNKIATGNNNSELDNFQAVPSHSDVHLNSKDGCNKTINSNQSLPDLDGHINLNYSNNSEFHQNQTSPIKNNVDESHHRVNLYSEQQHDYNKEVKKSVKDKMKLSENDSYKNFKISYPHYKQYKYNKNNEIGPLKLDHHDFKPKDDFFDRDTDNIQNETKHKNSSHRKRQYSYTAGNEKETHHAHKKRKNIQSLENHEVKDSNHSVEINREKECSYSFQNYKRGTVSSSMHHKRKEHISSSGRYRKSEHHHSTKSSSRSKKSSFPHLSNSPRKQRSDSRKHSSHLKQTVDQQDDKSLQSTKSHHHINRSPDNMKSLNRQLCRPVERSKSSSVHPNRPRKNYRRSLTENEKLNREDSSKTRERHHDKRRLRRNRRRSTTPKDLPCLSLKTYKYLCSTPADDYYCSKEMVLKKVIAAEDSKAIVTDDSKEVISTEDSKTIATEELKEVISTEDSKTIATEELKEVIATEDSKDVIATEDSKEVVATEDSKEVIATDTLKALHEKFRRELVERAERVRASKPKYEPPRRRTKLRKPKPPKTDSNDDSSSSSEKSSSEDEDTSMEELERKKRHPYRLHLELWFNDPKEMNDGPLCRCSAKARRAGIRHGIYVGEDHLPLCDPFSNNADKLYHYRITMTPHTNFLTKNPTTIYHKGHHYRFEGFSMFSHSKLPPLPNCKVIRFNYEYTIVYAEEEFPKNFTIQGLELFSHYLLVEILELVDLNWKAHDDPDGCPRFHFMPRFTRELKDGGKELLSHCYVLAYLLKQNKILIDENKISKVLALKDRSWQDLADDVKGMIVTCPGMKPSSIRVDQLDREQCYPNKEFPVIVHFGVRPPQLSYAGNPHYQKAWRDYVKYRHLLANKPKVSYADRHKLNQKENRLQEMRMENDLKRDVTVVISSQDFFKTGIMSDIVQHAMLLPVLVCHLRFHQSLTHLEKKIGYQFQDRFLLQLALTHPSYRENFGTNPDHARNSLTNCGLRQPQYGDRRIHYMNTRKRGINTLINIMSRFGSRKETLSRINHNERLEFLGDAVVEFLSSIHLFYMFPDLEEGGLATYRAAIVQNQHLAVLSKKLELDRFMLYAHGSDLCHDLELRHAMANCFEALMGALFLDNGIEIADKVFSKTLFSEPELLEVWMNFSRHPLQEQEPDGDRRWIETVPLLQKLHKFEETIGIEFNHIRLLARALTHRSLGYNNLTLGSNQRLEFLGDTVLQLVASEYLYKYFPEHHEGHLSLLRSSLVNNRTQAVVCADLGMVDYAIYPYDKVELKPKDKADLLEAFLGALYVDKDLGYCRTFCEVCFFPRLQDFIMNQDWNDPKSKLQQCCLTLRSMDGGEPDIPTYKVIECKGPTNTRVYSVAVYFQGNRLAVGSGHSIQQAEMDAAANALKMSKDLFPQLRHQRRAIERSLKKRPLHTNKHSLKRVNEDTLNTNKRFRKNEEKSFHKSRHTPNKDKKETANKHKYRPEKDKEKTTEKEQTCTPEKNNHYRKNKKKSFDKSRHPPNKDKEDASNKSMCMLEKNEEKTSEQEQMRTLDISNHYRKNKEHFFDKSKHPTNKGKEKTHNKGKYMVEHDKERTIEQEQTGSPVNSNYHQKHYKEKSFHKRRHLSNKDKKERSNKHKYTLKSDKEKTTEQEQICTPDKSYHYQKKDKEKSFDKSKHSPNKGKEETSSKSKYMLEKDKEKTTEQEQTCTNKSNHYQKKDKEKSMDKSKHHSNKET